MTRPSSETSTPAGTVMGRRPIRDMAAYQMYARISPPSWACLAWLPVMIPLEGETITMPRPPSTRGMSVFCAYTRRPGLLIRLRPETTGTLPSTYLSSIRSIWDGPARSSRTSAMKPSSLRMRAISRFVREAGTTTSVGRARYALRTRVTMSAIGSETFMVLPARLRDAGQLADERALAEADAAQREPAHVRTRASADGAPVVRLDRERRRSLRLRDH